MRNHWIRKYLPTRESIRAQKSLGPVRHLLMKPELWHLHRRSVGGAFFIGLFCAFLPVPSQMLIAALIAVVARCNLPIAVTLVWISNPLTMGPMFYFAYKLGAWLLDVELTHGPWEWSWTWLGTRFAAIWWPLILGCLVCGWVSGLTGTVAARLLWRLHIIRRWRNRRSRREKRASVPTTSRVEDDGQADGHGRETTAASAPMPSAEPGPDSRPSP